MNVSVFVGQYYPEATTTLAGSQIFLNSGASRMSSKQIYRMIPKKCVIELHNTYRLKFEFYYRVTKRVLRFPEALYSLIPRLHYSRCHPFVHYS